MSLEVLASQEAQGVKPCVSPVSPQREVMDSKASLKIEPDTASCKIAELDKEMQIEGMKETSESIVKSAKKIEESKLNLKPKQFRLTSHQKQELQAVFTKTFYVSWDQKQALATELGLSNEQVT